MVIMVLGAGVLICGVILVLHCCLKAASDADEYMERLQWEQKD